MNNDTPAKGSRVYLENQIRSARSYLLTILAFTLVNLFLLLAESQTYFLFSISAPYYLTAFGIGMDSGVGGSVFTVTALTISALILVSYLLCFLLSKKFPVCYLISLILLSIDTVILIAVALSFDLLVDSILDLLFHGWVLLWLARAVSAQRKLRALPPEELPLAPEQPQAVFAEADAQEPSEASAPAQD